MLIMYSIYNQCFYSTYYLLLKSTVQFEYTLILYGWNYVIFSMCVVYVVCEGLCLWKKNCINIPKYQPLKSKRIILNLIYQK